LSSEEFKNSCKVNIAKPAYINYDLALVISDLNI